MARKPRLDTPGAWHHVMNRGIARRTVFETRQDFREFLAGVARAARCRQIEVHAFCLMSTHFHLLVRSPSGRLSEGMRSVLNGYVRRFNHRRGRDGALFRGRFLSKLVQSLTYRHLLVRYIDSNPVSAGMTAAAENYPYGSARWYAQTTGPPWLERSWVESTVRAGTRRSYDPRGYRQVFRAELPVPLRELVAARISAKGIGADPLDDLAGAASPTVLDWLRQRALLADGTVPVLAVCNPQSVAAVVDRERRSLGQWILRPGRKAVDGWTQVHAGLLYDLCGLSGSQVGRILGFSASGVGKLRARHRLEIAADDTYASRVGEMARGALDLSGLHRRIVVDGA